MNQIADQRFYHRYGGLIGTNINNEESGSDVERVVGPRTGLYLGSVPDQTILPQTIASLNINLPTANNWIRGHLLNDWIGGSGSDNENLVPMSHTTNQQWNRGFEQKLKSITEVVYSSYNGLRSRYSLLVGYTATASGLYGPANAQGIDIPNQFDGNWYYGAYDRITGASHYDNTTVTAAFNELTQNARNRIAQIEGQIVQTIMQTH